MPGQPETASTPLESTFVPEQQWPAALLTDGHGGKRQRQRLDDSPNSDDR